MTVVEYNNEKNRILRETLGLDFDLIPSSQNKEVVITHEQVMKLDSTSVVNSCIYCVVMQSIEDVSKSYCTECPMSKAGNKCSSSGSTWSQYFSNIEVMHVNPLSPAHKPMVELVKKFKREYSSNYKSTSFYKLIKGVFS